MVDSLLDGAASADRLRQLGETGVLDPPTLRRALELAAGSPPPVVWTSFLSRTLLLLGALLVASGVIDFFAFNWASLPAGAKLGGLEALVAVTALGALRPGSSRVVRQVLLLTAALLVGPLLGVYGQTYQTGADPFELFLGWAALVLPWALAARMPALWMLQIVLLDLGLSLCLSQTSRVRHDPELVALLVVAGVHAVAVVIHEVLAARGVAGAQARWWPRLLTASGLTLLLAPTLLFLIKRQGLWRFIFGSEASLTEKLGAAMMAAALTAIALAYRGRRRDPFMIVAAIGCLIAIVTTWLGRILGDDLGLGVLGVLLTGMLVVGQVGAAVTWLRRSGVGREGES